MKKQRQGLYPLVSVNISLFLAILLIAQTARSQSSPVAYHRQAAIFPDSIPVRVYPSNWWVGMKRSDLQIMIRGKDIAKELKSGNTGKGAGAMATTLVTIDYPGVKLRQVHTVESPNYLFLDLQIAVTAKSGMAKIRIGHGGGLAPTLIDFPLLARRPGNGSGFAQGVTQADMIYFLMPDRFSNGDTSNDRIPGMRDQSLDRDSIFLRHGGDLQGIIDHLDYIQGLGFTTLWMTPVLENDMPNRTEHGYAFTDHYTIEPRLGGSILYKRLGEELHRRGMKLIQDAVYNHVGLYHFLVQDPPSRDWLHQWPVYTQTSFRDEPLMDPHGSSYDRKITSDGWFTPEMPDLNQGNPYVANYLINHAIWCVETFGVDAWRIDTYIYNDLAFMNRCNQALFDEYPHITLFGETWVHGTANQAYFAENNLQLPYKSNLPGVTDFQCNFNGIVPALTEPFGWTAGVNRLYATLSNDFLYKDPSRNVIFLDNHDMSRFFSQVGENVEKQKMGIEWLLTCRGIPQLYYGTEMLMKGISNPDGWVRMDFPGGWKGDRKNAFTGAGLTPDELSVQQLVRTLGNFRKGSSALRTGKMMQFLPQDGLYVYFRYDDRQTIMCVMNTTEKALPLHFDRFAERTGGYSQAVDVLSGARYSIKASNPADKGEIMVPATRMWVLELEK